MPRAARSYPRHLAPRLREALADTPAVLIHGPRQSGKTTLARAVGEPRGYRYVSFDDEAVASAARNDPVGFVDALPPKVTLDEVQRVPEIFKAAIDQRRTGARRRAWYRDYVESQIQRDVRDLSRIRSFDALPKLLALAASQTARLVNVAELSAPFELTRQTIHEYVTLLERVFLLERLPSWLVNRMSRLVKRTFATATTFAVLEWRSSRSTSMAAW